MARICNENMTCRARREFVPMISPQKNQNRSSAGYMLVFVSQGLIRTFCKIPKKHLSGPTFGIRAGPSDASTARKPLNSLPKKRKILPGITCRPMLEDLWSRGKKKVIFSNPQKSYFLEKEDFGGFQKSSFFTSSQKGDIAFLGLKEDIFLT